MREPLKSGERKKKCFKVKMTPFTHSSWNNLDVTSLHRHKQMLKIIKERIFETITEGNAPQSSQISDFGVLEQYLGYRVGDPSSINKSPMFNPTANGQTVGPDLLSSPFDKAFGLTNTSVSGGRGGLQATELQKSSQLNLGSSSSARHENWGESNHAESSSRTDTSTDMDPDDRNKLVDQSGAAAVSDSSDKSKDKTLDQKTLRRLAQNREAARKSRLRKKAYVQQLENSRLKLTQLEQELQRARQQGIFISNIGDQSVAGTANGILAFDAEYARWMEDQNRLISELRTAVNAHAGDVELRTIVDNVTAHFNDIYRMKGNAAKADVFHILSGMWKTPAERCFMWIGGFRPSDLLKVTWVREAEHLDWLMRLRIAMGMAYCLSHMHQLKPPLSHRNLTSSSVYLTEDYAAKISDFVFWDSSPNSQTAPPDNVYSFGVILFEMMTGRLPYSAGGGGSGIEDWAEDYLTRGDSLKDIVDPKLATYSVDQLLGIGDVIRACVEPDPIRRVSMREVCERLKGVTGIGPDGAVPKLSPLWWAEIEIMSNDVS
ncbi:TGA transcription factor [Striga asiatica]|uniref:TGA transcription factor n=1 Tax=Striga asiatica TaxID=4170 RepID=A0A5A7QZW3_STRAF|nr:TGA transcription factor [Striga asiatica]